MTSRNTLVILIMGVILLLGCTSISRVADGMFPEPTPTTNATAEAYWRAYEQNIKYRELNAEIIATIPDSELYPAALDIIWLKLKDRDDWQQALREMPPGYTTIYYISWFEGAVNNGGYNQYFSNSSGEYAVETLEALKLIGAKEIQANFEKAVAIHLAEAEDPRLQELYDDQTIESFMETYKYSSLGECDDEFYQLANLFGKYQAEFIRGNPELFTEK